MGNDTIFIMYRIYYNRKFIIWSLGFRVRGSGVAMGAGRPLIPFENLV